MTITVIVLLQNREAANHLDLCYQRQNIKPPLPVSQFPPNSQTKKAHNKQAKTICYMLELDILVRLFAL